MNSITNWHGPDKWLNAKFDKDMNSIKQKLHGPFKNIQVAG